MKTLIVSVVVFISVLLQGRVFAQASEFRILISPTQPDEITALANGSFVAIERLGIAHNKSPVFNYGMILFAKENSETPKIPDAVMFFALTPKLNPTGEVIPDTYVKQLVGMVFLDEKVAWFISREVEAVFREAAK